MDGKRGGTVERATVGAEEALLVLGNATLIDGTGRPPIEDARVVLRGERIVAAGPAREIALPQAAHQFLDLESAFILPGLIDVHVHLTVEGGPSGTFENAEDDSLLTTLWQAQRTLQAGFTTVRDLGGRNYVEFTVRRAIDRGMFFGPRLVLAGKIVSMTSAGALYWPGMYREADGPDEVRKATREQLKAGVDVVKVMATGSAMTPGERPAPQYSVEEMRAAVEEAHKVGRPVAAHASGVEGIRNALDAGVDHIEHGSYLHEDPAAVGRMASQGVFLVPTCKAFATVVRRGSQAGIPEWMVAQNRLEYENNRNSLMAAAAAGVRIALGTDAGGPLNRHGENAEELSYLVDAGLSPMQAIVAATSVAAECVGLSGQIGTVEAGKRGDLVVVTRNPLDDINALAQRENIALVIKNGVPVARQGTLLAPRG